MSAERQVGRVPAFVKRLAPKRLLEPLFRLEARIAARWVASAHRRQMLVQWGLDPQPEFFDHHIDLYYQWRHSRAPVWLERGVFGALALKGGRVLELACGDGFNALNFYGCRSREVVACDFDAEAIRIARRRNRADNISYVLADIRTDLPEGRFENIVWDGAIEHFTPEEIDTILAGIRSRLAPGGILSGYTIVERGDGEKSLSHHEYEFKSKQDLMRFLEPHFAHVTVFETIYEHRHNLYFWASDAAVPFDEKWQAALRGGQRREDAVASAA
ncbi:MAG: hypothetical protein CMJ18_14690 [Phycisphaeraceae bacterium]|nr:hypothetical protein [Phycisphaeraceae bacterium]